MTITQAYSRACQNLQTFLPPGEQEVGEIQATARLLIDAIAATRHAHLKQPEQRLNSVQQECFENALRELSNGRPLAYVLGKREFYGLEFRCDERALVPRPETELLVEQALQEIKARASTLRAKIETDTAKTDATETDATEFQETPLRIADLGTGTGCIAISIAVSLAQTLPRAEAFGLEAFGLEVFATDISPAALELARENASTLGVAHRVQFIRGEAKKWASPLSHYSNSFDIIVSNPPYIAPRDIENLQTQIKDFEPYIALDGGEDGLDCYREIAAQCGVLVKPGGAVLCELGANQFEAVRAIFEKNNWRVRAPVLDFAGISRVLIAVDES